MTAERPEEGFGNSLINRQIARIINKSEALDVLNIIDEIAIQNKEVCKEDLFTKPRIEQVALATIENLNELLQTIPQEELDKKHKDNDVLQNAYHNNEFVFNRVISSVYNLISHTNQPVYLTDEKILCYSFYTPKSENSNEDDEVELEPEVIDFENEPEIYLVVDDRKNDEWYSLDSAFDIQDAWETSAKNVRDDLRIFSKYTKREIIEIFKTYAKEYADLPEDEDTNSTD